MAMVQNKKRRMKRRIAKPKICRLCENKIAYIDFKDAELLKKFQTEKGRILPRRITGTCAGKTPPEHTYAVRVRAKKRHINPLVQTHSGMKRQTELDEGFAAQLRAFLQDDFDRFVWASFAD